MSGDCGVRIADVRVSNFRSLRNVEVSLGDMTILVGANNAGKTSFLDAVYAALGIGRSALGKDDISLMAGEALLPQDRKVLIDIRILPVDESGNSIDVFPAGSFWTTLWGTGISQDANFNDFLAFRTVLSWSPSKGDYSVERKFLKEWRPFADWIGTETKDRGVSAMQLEPINSFYVDAKRDIEDDLRRQGSFWRRLTENLGLSGADVDDLESELSALNERLVEKSGVLRHIKENLGDMSAVVNADSAGVDISPIARKLRDLSKGVDVTFATKGAQSFPLSRHGMGTRSLASLLVFRAFASWRSVTANSMGEHVHSLLALEEPEAHLHPQAQRSLFAQIKSIPGQRIVSTHSPYFAGQASLSDLRLFKKVNGVSTATSLNVGELDEDQVRRIEREVMVTRGDILFSRALILFEGVTEEQALPLWAEAYWGASPHELGFNFVGVGGKNNYFPFLWLAKNFDIPWYIFSDGEDSAVQAVMRDLDKIGVQQGDAAPNVIVLPNKNDFEAQLVSEGYVDAVGLALDKIDGAGALDAYIADMHGEPGRKKTVRNYQGEGGRERAAIDALRERKTRLAQPMARAILGLEQIERRVPVCVESLLDVISNDFGLEKRKAL